MNTVSAGRKFRVGIHGAYDGFRLLVDMKLVAMPRDAIIQVDCDNTITVQNKVSFNHRTIERV